MANITPNNDGGRPADALTAEEIKVFNKALEERIAEASKDKTKWKDLLPDLMNAEVFVIAQRNPNPDNPSVVSVNFLVLTNSDGQQAIPFFTSPNRLSVMIDAQHQRYNCMKMKTVKFFQLIKGKPCVLNPRTPEARLFTPFEMNLLVMEDLKKHPDNVAKSIKPIAPPEEKA